MLGGHTHRPRSGSFLWVICKILYGNPKKELLRGLWVAGCQWLISLMSRADTCCIVEDMYVGIGAACCVVVFPNSNSLLAVGATVFCLSPGMSANKVIGWIYTSDGHKIGRNEN